MSRSHRAAARLSPDRHAATDPLPRIQTPTRRQTVLSTGPSADVNRAFLALRALLATVRSDSSRAVVMGSVSWFLLHKEYAMNTATSSSMAGRFRLAALTLAIALPALVNAATDTPEGSPQATSASVYADAIGSSRFERSGIRVEHGYTVESGNLYTRDGDTGSLVVVRSPDGAVTAIVDEPGRRGLLVVDTQGKTTFTEEPPYNYMTPDTVESIEDSSPVASDSQVSVPSYIDMLVAYSADALGLLNTDPIAFALAQLETANLGLRNSRVENLSLRLVAVNIFDVSHDVTGDGLSAWQTMLAPFRTMYKTDLNATYSVGGNAGGWAYIYGHTSVNAWNAAMAFRHEIGHNAGGNHCNDDPTKYSFGYNNGQSKTHLCGNSVPYYSTPAVNDAHGLPLGNAQTADMARAWRGNTIRLISYNIARAGDRMLLVRGAGDTTESSARLRIPLNGFRGGVVALSSEVGPTTLIPSTGEQSTLIRVALKNSNYHDVDVVLRGIRHLGTCSGIMNSSSDCALGTVMELELKYYPSDNVSLPPGYYNGFVILEARKPNSDWKMPINIAISVKK